MTIKKTWKVRTLKQRLRALGCKQARTAGSHETWLTPRGRAFGLVVHRSGADVTPGDLATVRRALEREGLALDVEPRRRVAALGGAR